MKKATNNCLSVAFFFFYLPLNCFSNLLTFSPRPKLFQQLLSFSPRLKLFQQFAEFFSEA